MKTLKISKEISLPLDAVTQTMAAIGRKGAGKTYLSQMIAEQMLDAGVQTIVVDPVGNWWGLRVAADGKTKGKEIFVIGGDHGDVPLVPEAGKRIAQLLVEKGVSAILDVSGFGVGEHKRFCADFGEEFFQLKKKKRTPVHLFLEESQLIVPQIIRPEEGRMYSAFERIVRLGRNYGIGCTLITQRPQSVNKEVLSQVECLCVLQITGPHERKALEYWVQEVGADRKLIGELPGLSRGEGYVWSPAWLRVYKRVHFSKKQTFDASATPEVGKKTQAASLSAVDVQALKADMKDVVEQAEKDDPRSLRRRIKELETHVCPKVTQNPVRVEKIRVPTIGKRSLEGVKKAESSLRKMLKSARESVDIIESALNKFSADVQKLRTPTENMMFGTTPIHVTPNLPEKVLADFSEPRVVIKATDGQDVGICAKKIYSFLYENAPSGFTKVQLGAVTGYSPKSGGFNNSLARLNSLGLIQKIGDKVVFNHKTFDESLVIRSEKYSKEIWLSKLGKCERAVYSILLENPDEEYLKDQLGSLTGYSPTSGGFNNSIAHLNSIGLIRRDSMGQIRLNPELQDL